MSYKKKELREVHKGVQETIHKKMNSYANKIVVGQYTGKKEVKREEGEVWFDDENREWEMKGSRRQGWRPLSPKPRGGVLFVKRQ